MRVASIDWETELAHMPYARAFFAEGLRRGGAASELAQPPLALRAAVEAVSVAAPWSSDDLTAERVAGEWGDEDLRERLATLASETLAVPEAGWMSAPIVGSRQVSVFQDSMAWDPTTEQSVSFEVYASRPLGALVTSTLLPGGLTSWTEGARVQAGDLPEIVFPFDTHAVRVLEEERVFEVHGPDDWRALCERYPRVSTTGVPNWPQEWTDGLEAQGTNVVSPHWRHLAVDYDAVHISLLGMLTISSVPMLTDARLARVLSHDAECTYWLNPPKGDWEPITLD